MPLDQGEELLARPRTGILLPTIRQRGQGLGLHEQFDAPLPRPNAIQSQLAGSRLQREPPPNLLSEVHVRD